MVHVRSDAQQGGARKHTRRGGQGAACEIFGEHAVAVSLKREGQGRLAMPPWGGEYDGSGLDLHRGGVEREVAAMHAAQRGRNSPHTLLAEQFIVALRHLDPAG